MSWFLPVAREVLRRREEEPSLRTGPRTSLWDYPPGQQKGTPLYLSDYYPTHLLLSRRERSTHSCLVCHHDEVHVLHRPPIHRPATADHRLLGRYGGLLFCFKTSFDWFCSFFFLCLSQFSECFWGFRNKNGKIFVEIKFIVTVDRKNYNVYDCLPYWITMRITGLVLLGFA